MTLATALPSLPFTDPVLIVATAATIFLAVPLLFERFRVPGIIGLIIVGAAVGPNGLGLLARDATIVLLGTVGLLYLMFLVGLELDLEEFNRHRHRSIIFGLLGFALPQALGTGICLALGYSMPAAVLLGAMFASHTLLAYPIASRLGIVKTPSVTTVLGATLLTDLLALLVLAIVSGAQAGGIGPAFWASMLVRLAVYVAALLWAVPRLTRWFFRHVGGDGSAEFLFTLAMLFLWAYLAHVAGIEPIIGALLAGFAMNRLIPEHGALMNRIRFVSNTVFVPFFLLSVGMLVDVRAFADRDAWVAIGLLVASVVASKWAAAWVTGRIFRFRAEERWVMFGLSVSHAAATMAITLVGYELELFDEAVVNAVVVVILVTCLVGPWAVQRYGRAVALAVEREPPAPGTAPRRILIPLANPATAPQLMDLAMIVRGDAPEPLLPLTVVRGEETEAEVAEAERMLSHAVAYASGAEVEVRPLTRVDPNVAAGIARGVAETRAWGVVIGWDGRRTGARAIFGTVLDRLLEQTRRLVRVARLGHPLNVTRRVVVIHPPGTERHPAFADVAGVVHRLAAGTGADLRILAVRGDPDALREAWAAARPGSSPHVLVAGEWARLLPELRTVLRPDDLPVLLGARRGTLFWHPRLERLPDQLAGMAPASFVALFPPDAEPEEGEDPFRISEHLAPERVVQLTATDWPTAVRRLAEAQFPARMAGDVATAVLRGGEEFSSEILPGIVLPHVRLPVGRPTLVVGVSRDGIEVPRARHPARLIFLLVSPADRAEEHLRALAEIAGALATPRQVAELMDRLAPGTTLDWLHVDD